MLTKNDIVLSSSRLNLNFHTVRVLISLCLLCLCFNLNNECKQIKLFNATIAGMKFYTRAFLSSDTI